MKEKKISEIAFSLKLVLGFFHRKTIFSLQLCPDKLSRINYIPRFKMNLTDDDEKYFYTQSSIYS